MGFVAVQSIRVTLPSLVTDVYDGFLNSTVVMGCTNDRRCASNCCVCVCVWYSFVATGLSFLNGAPLLATSLFTAEGSLFAILHSPTQSPASKSALYIHIRI